MNVLLEGLQSAEPHTVVLVLTSLVDHFLEISIRLNFQQLSDSRAVALFRAGNAPLSSFSSKITVAAAFGIVDDLQEEYLNRVRSIRNHFAHSIFAASFDEETVCRECMQLDPARLDPKCQPDIDGPQERFIISISLVIVTIAKHILAHRKTLEGHGVDTVNELEAKLGLEPKD